MKVYMRDGRVIRIHANSMEGRIVRGLLPPVIFGTCPRYVDGKREKALKWLKEQGIINYSIDPARFWYFAELLVPENVVKIEAPEGVFEWDDP